MTKCQLVRITSKGKKTESKNDLLLSVEIGKTREWYFFADDTFEPVEIKAQLEDIVAVFGVFRRVRVDEAKIRICVLTSIGISDFSVQFKPSSWNWISDIKHRIEGILSDSLGNSESPRAWKVKIVPPFTLFKDLEKRGFKVEIV